ncbi:MAG: hypothetical protein V2A66_07540 [Pseudomonadota bacterium]
MKRAMRLKLEMQDGRAPLEAEFGREGMLFLSSSREGLCLVKEVAPGQIAYAVFARRSRGLVCAALQDAALAGRDERIGAIGPGDAIALGLTRLSVADSRVPWRARISRRVCLFGAMAFLLAIATMAAIFQRGPVAAPSYPLPVAVDPAPAAQAVSVVSATRLIEEARDHLRAGRIEQARLALIETTESAPEDAEARRLLEELNSGDDAQAAGKKSESSYGDELSSGSEEEALALFKDGMRLKGLGDLVGAKSALDRAAEILRAGGIRPTFAGPLDEARVSLAASVRDDAAPRLAAIGAMLSSVDSLDAREAVSRLGRARAEVQAATDAGAGNAAASLKARIDASIKSAAGRWLSGALSAERFSGCGRALPIYEEISSALSALDPSASESAAEGVRRCKGAGDEGRHRP